MREHVSLRAYANAKATAVRRRRRRRQGKGEGGSSAPSLPLPPAPPHRTWDSKRTGRPSDRRLRIRPEEQAADQLSRRCWDIVLVSNPVPGQKHHADVGANLGVEEKVSRPGPHAWHRWQGGTPPKSKRPDHDDATVRTAAALSWPCGVAAAAAWSRCWRAGWPTHHCRPATAPPRGDPSAPQCKAGWPHRCSAG